MIRAKMTVESIIENLNQGVKDSESIILRAVYGDSEENKSWSKWTPSASVNISITNPACWGTFVQGKTMYVDFSEVN